MKTILLFPAASSQNTSCKYLQSSARVALALPVLVALPSWLAPLEQNGAPQVFAVAHAQSTRFSLRAEPDVIAANGISTTSISVQVPTTQSTGGISATPIVRFITTAGTIESQARVVGGVARVLLRSSTTPGTALVTAIMSGAREQIAVEFTGDEVSLARYLEVKGDYIAYGAQNGVVTTSGRCSLQFGDLHIESDVRLDVDLFSERVWAQGGNGRVFIRNGRGAKMHELRGDRLFYDLRRRRGVIRRVDTVLGPARQEFMESDFRALPAVPQDTNTKAASADDKKPIIDSQTAVPITPQQAESAVPAENAPSEKTPAPNAIAPILPVVDAHSNTQTRAILQQRPFEGAPIQPSDARGEKRLALAPDASASDASTPDTLQVLATPNTAPKSDPLIGESASKPASMAAIIGQPIALTPQSSGNDILSGARLPIAALPATGLSLPGASSDDQTLRDVPEYEKLPQNGDENSQKTPDPTPVAAEQIVEPDPPRVDANYSGYWVSAKKMRVFARDKIQFERSTVYFNGKKLFSMPRYVAALDGAFNPATDMMSFNSSGGLTLNVPYYYQTSPRGTGTVYLQHAPRNGFAAESPGFALAVDQQYWLNDRSQGRLLVDQIGRAWNLNWQHKHQFSPTMRSETYLDMPRHRNMYLRSSLVKEFAQMQIGFEGLASRESGTGVFTSGGGTNFQGQFFARLRPRTLGKSGWSYSLAANALAVRRFAYLADSTPTNPTDPTDPTNPTDPGRPGNGGGVGLPGRPRTRSMRVAMNQSLAYARYVTRTADGITATPTVQTRPLWGQTMLATVQSPSKRLWNGASIAGSFFANGFNYSDGRRGLAPGFSLGMQQSLGRLGTLQLDYNYDRGGVGLGSSGLLGSYTNFVSGSLFMNFGSNFGGNAYFTKSLSDGALYGAATLDYYPIEKWRLGAFTDYSSFADIESYLDYGLSLGRQVGQREVSLNWSRNRGRVYLELGGLR